MSQAHADFGKWRAFFWPIHNYELKKIMPMLLMFFFISFNYSVLRNAKDALVVTAPGGGAEVIPFLKFWGVIPAAVIFMLIYSKLSNILSKEKLFYATIVPFLVFFVLFATVLYPSKDVLHPHIWAGDLQNQYPKLLGLIGIARNWTYSLFYIMSELWGSVALSLLFWGFANDITRINESKRFYALFGLGANVSLILAGQATQFLAKLQKNAAPGIDAWQIPLNYVTIVVSVFGLAIIAIYYWMNRVVLTDPRFYDVAEVKKAKKDKPKMSLGESFAFLARSKHLLCIAILVIAYGISINLIEVTWKSQLKLQFPETNDYFNFMGQVSQYTGWATIFLILFVANNVLRKFGWGVAALMTPVILLVTGFGFFAFVICKGTFEPFVADWGTTTLWIAIIFGAIQNVVSKSFKYSLFDPTKEMAYIPLDQESKVKGKAAIDVVGSRLGKAGGSLIQQFLIGAFGTLSACTPHIAGILFFIIAAWIWAARNLNRSLLALHAK